MITSECHYGFSLVVVCKVMGHYEILNRLSDSSLCINQSVAFMLLLNEYMREANLFKSIGEIKCNIIFSAFSSEILI